jgi:hypothetical protein
MMLNLRMGGPETLNIYFKAGPDGLLGQATFPSDYATESSIDSVFVGDAFVVGGGDTTFGEGVSYMYESVWDKSFVCQEHHHSCTVIVYLPSITQDTLTHEVGKYKSFGSTRSKTTYLKGLTFFNL